MEYYLRQERIDNTPLYNCTSRTVEEWKLLAKPNRTIGLVYLILGIVYELIYIPCLIVLGRQESLKNSCYKIMFFMGVMDMATLSINAIASGYFSITGAMFCTDPDAIYVLGCLCLAMWCCCCCCCMLLVVNRCIDVWKPHLYPKLFDGNRTVVWLLIPCLYFIWVEFFTHPILYDSNYHAWFLGPHIEGNPNPEAAYSNPTHVTNNVVLVAVTCSIYLLLAHILFRRFNVEYAQRRSSSQRTILVQSVLICFVNMVCSFLYIYMQFFYAPDALIVTGQIFWQLCHSCPAMIYLTLNRTMRREVWKMLVPKRLAKLWDVPIVYSVSMQRSPVVHATTTTRTETRIEPLH